MTLSNLSIKGFRGFERFEVHQLCPVNLIVGRNNAGKTTFLEAVSLMESDHSVFALLEILSMRGERVRLYRDEGDPRPRPPIVTGGLDPTHLFTGRSLAEGSAFRVETDTPQRHIEIAAHLATDTSTKQETIFPDDEDQPTSELELKISHTARAYLDVIPLSPEGYIDDRRLRVRGVSSQATKNVEYLGPSLFLGSLSRKWNVIGREKLEGKVAQALQIVAPDIQDIFYTGEGGPLRTSFLAGLESANERVPLASMGEGVWRLLSLVLTGLSAQGGVLLVDEIDTGLHHTVLEKMWEVVTELAERGTQVFATTHSSDCIRALAKLCKESPEAAEMVAVHRIEAGDEEAVTYRGDELVRAVEMDVELRGW
jgi:hypothetical protein